MEPDILLMDEPFAALDALTRRKMQDELLQLWDDTRFTVLFVTHSIPEAVLIGNRILLLSPHPGPGEGASSTATAAIPSTRDGVEAVGPHPRHAVCRSRSRNRRPCPMAELRAPVTRLPAPCRRSGRSTCATPCGRRHRRGAEAADAFGSGSTTRRWLRKALILVVHRGRLGGLRAPAQQPAAGADLLGDASRPSGRGIASGDMPQKASNSVQAAAEGLCARASCWRSC